MPLRIIGLDFLVIPGDYTDARLNLFFLENGYQWLIGNIDSFWQSNFFYPYKNPIALSDNLIGTLPVFALFRTMGCDIYLSYQLWILSLFSLNYFVSYFAFKHFTKNKIWAIIGAYIFAFGLYNLTFINHLQLLPKFPLVIGIVWFLKFFQNKNSSYFYLSSLALVYQFLCGIYLGFFFTLTIGIILCSHLILNRNVNALLILFNKENRLKSAAYLIVGLIILLALGYPYYLKSSELGYWTYNKVIHHIPKPQSYFFAHYTSEVWNPLLFSHAVGDFKHHWNHAHFIGIIPYLGLLTTVYLLVSNPKKYKPLMFVFVSWLLLIVLTLRFGDFSLFYWLNKLPGLASIRAVYRIVIPINVLLLIILVFALDQLLKKRYFLIVPILFVTFIDNSFRANWELSRFSVEHSKKMIAQIKSSMPTNFDPNKTYVFIKEDLSSLHYNEPYYFNVSCMLAAQELKIKTINGHSSLAPPGFKSIISKIDLEGFEKVKHKYNLSNYEIVYVED